MIVLIIKLLMIFYVKYLVYDFSLIIDLITLAFIFLAFSYNPNVRKRGPKGPKTL